jgi:hypothetical protein
LSGDDFSRPLDPSQIPVTRIEVLDFVTEAFVFGRVVDRASLLHTARAAGARPELLQLLEHLPDVRLTEPAQLWIFLHVPEDLAAAGLPPRHPHECR